MARFSLTANPVRVERAVILVGLFFVVGAGLLSTQRLSDRLMMAAMEGGAGLGYLALLFAMWWTMMMAMMLPSATPAILTFASLHRKLDKDSGAVALGAFIAGYVVVWSLFCLGVVALQVFLGNLIQLDMMMALESAWIGGALLVAAGLYQLSPLKWSCLSKCQSPLLFFAHRWRPGSIGALRMGFSHGLYCLGCCWVLMVLLFYGGVMELRWIVGLAVFVAAEKLIPAGNRLSRFAGLILIGWGLWTVWLASGGSSTA